MCVFWKNQWVKKVFDLNSIQSAHVFHNWNGEEAVKLEKQVLGFFGFKTPDVLSFNWQWTKDKNDESKKGYLEDFGDFLREFDFVESLKESILKFTQWIKK